jgi:hypothetical protein
LRIFVCTFPNAAYLANGDERPIFVKERIGQIAGRIRGAHIDENFIDGDNRIMQVSCASIESVVYMKLALANIANIHVAEFCVIADTMS